ncbi:hypothetical protein Tco_0285267, partial [Tanacetum coccineum]
ECAAESSGGSGDGGDATPQGIHVWIERFTKLKPLAFRSAVTPAEAEDWITHMEKLFQVFGVGWRCLLLELVLGLLFVKLFQQYFRHLTNNVYERCGMGRYISGSREFWGILWKVHLGGLVSFVGTAAGDAPRQARHFKWGLKKWVLDRIVNTEYTNVAQVAAAARNIDWVVMTRVSMSIGVVRTRVLSIGCRQDRGYDSRRTRIFGSGSDVLMVGMGMTASGQRRNLLRNFSYLFASYHLFVLPVDKPHPEAELCQQIFADCLLLQTSLCTTRDSVAAETSGTYLDFHGCKVLCFCYGHIFGGVPNIENLSVVREFVDVFPDELPGLPPAREIEFGIELIPGAEPISKAPYRMAPVELKELKEQLQEMWRWFYLDLSVITWGAPVLLVRRKIGSMRLVYDYREITVLQL